MPNIGIGKSWNTHWNLRTCEIKTYETNGRVLRVKMKYLPVNIVTMGVGKTAAISNQANASVILFAFTEVLQSLYMTTDSAPEEMPYTKEDMDNPVKVFNTACPTKEADIVRNAA